ncbi:MAG: Bax inhibitor-1/YccA family protein [Candidatus Microsaccharimonas sp.]
MAQQSGNPALKNKAFQSTASVGSQSMSMAGVSLKSFFLLLLCLAGAGFGWSMALQAANSLWLILTIASIGGLIIGLITSFNPRIAWATGPLYALTQGYILGVISFLANLEFPGIVIQAVLLTLCIFMVTLFVYATGIIKVTRKFVFGVIIATAGVALYYLAYLIIGLFGIELPLVNSNSPWGIAFSVLIVIIASLNLILDFDFIKNAVQQRVPKFLEWYAAFSLIVTLLWLYVEVLRLLGKSRR